MATTMTEQPVYALEIVRNEEIAAPIDVVFATVLEQLGPEHDVPGAGPLPMTLEAWPGGRWYRDLGNDAGHFWGTVQAIKPPMLLEICGPLFMSYPALSNVQLRLSEDGGRTSLRFVHRVMGQCAHDPRITEGWDHLVAKIRATAERRLPG